LRNKKNKTSANSLEVGDCRFPRRWKLCSRISRVTHSQQI